jgi:hypothetical protein
LTKSSGCPLSHSLFLYTNLHTLCHSISFALPAFVLLLLGDDEAKRRGVQKSILERAAPPTFDVAVEMLERNKWHVYADVASAVDALLAGQNPGGQMRERAADGSILKYSYSRGGAASPSGDSRRGSSSSSGQRVLPELRRPGAAAAAAAGVAVAEGVDAEAAAAAGGFVRPRLFVAEGQEPGPGERAGAWFPWLVVGCILLQALQPARHVIANLEC